MPTVARYGPLQVPTRALPGARKSAAETELSTGAGLHAAEADAARRIGQAEQGRLGVIAQTGATVAHLGASLFAEEMEVRRQERKRADQVKALEWRNALDQWNNEMLYRPGGALSKKGKDAQDLPETIGTAFDAYTADYAETLHTPEQRLAFAQDAAKYRRDNDLTIYRHVAREQQTYEATELEAQTANRLQAAVANSADPRAVGDAVAAGEQALRASLPHLGAGPERVTQQVRAFRSQAFEGVIMQQITEGHVDAARAYFEEAHGAQTFDKDAITRITEALATGDVRRQAQQETAKILAEGGSLDEQRARAKTINDPKVQDDVLARLEHEHGVQEARERKQQQTLVEQAYVTVDQTHSLDALSPETINALGAHLPALRAYANKLATGEPIVTDWALYSKHIKLAGEDPVAFAKSNIEALRGSLEDAEYKRLLELRLAIQTGDRRKTDEILKGPYTVTQIVNTTLTAHGINPQAKPGTAEAKAIAQLEQLLSRRIAAAQQPDPKTGKATAVTDTEIQATLDELLSQGEAVPGSWWNIWPGGKSVSDTRRRLIDTTIGDIPAGDRKLIEQKLRASGLPVSDATILNVYIESKIK